MLTFRATLLIMVNFGNVIFVNLLEFYNISRFTEREKDPFDTEMC